MLTLVNPTETYYGKIISKPLPLGFAAVNTKKVSQLISEVFLLYDSPPKKKDLAPRIRQIRAALNLTPAQFASKLDVSVPTIHRWENPKAPKIPTKQNVLKLNVFLTHSEQKNQSDYWIEISTEDKPKLWGIDFIGLENPPAIPILSPDQKVTFRACIVQRPLGEIWEPVLRAIDIRVNNSLL
jgi:transcriptional regulator with XRE-family HTH domain